MIKKIAIIDPYVVAPAVNCLNRLMLNLAASFTYHAPHVYGVSTLEHGQADAYIVLGSKSNICENLPWHKPLADFLIAELHDRKPVLGICFGHQLMAHAFGGEVDFIVDEELVMKGTREVTFKESFGNIKAGDQLSFLVTHKQVIKKLPDSFRAIGTSTQNGYDMPYDVVAHNELPYLGIQAHPEASLAFAHSEIKFFDETQIAKAQADGMKLIKAFLVHRHQSSN